MLVIQQKETMRKDVIVIYKQHGSHDEKGSNIRQTTTPDRHTPSVRHTRFNPLNYCASIEFLLIYFAAQERLQSEFIRPLVARSS